MTGADDCVGEELCECPLCGCTGVFERTRPWNHSCDALKDDQPDHAELRDGETRGDSHAARNAAMLAALERELDGGEDR